MSETQRQNGRPIWCRIRRLIVYFSPSRATPIIFLVPLYNNIYFILSHAFPPHLFHRTIHSLFPVFLYIYIYIYTKYIYPKRSLRKLAHFKATDITVLILRVRFTDTYVPGPANIWFLNNNIITTTHDQPRDTMQ